MTLSINVVHAAASLGFSPQRIVLKDNQRSTSLTLTNRGDTEAIFRISMTDVIYNPDGTVTQTIKPPPGYPTARQLIRFSPRQVQLKPGETQRVRVLLKSPKRIADGEYRIHALMKQVPDANSSNKTSDDDKKTLKGDISFSQAVAIPIIVRRGVSNTKSGIASIKRQDSKLNLMLWRTGNQSTYNNIEVYAGKVTESRKVTEIKGFSVPVPNTKRILSLNTEKYKFKPPYVLILRDHDSGKILDQKQVN